MVSKNKTRIAIIGGGITGLASAYFLNKKKYSITIFNRPDSKGGLAGSTLINGVPLEKFYHHFFTSDIDLIKLSQELNIDDQISYYPSSVGFYINKDILPFTTPFDLLKFSPIPLLDRIKMGLITLYFIKKNSWQDLEKITCRDFFHRLSADRLYDVVWRPLLQSKFGVSEPYIPATFLWGRINPRGRSRKGAGEQLAYFNNSFSTLFEALSDRLKSDSVKQIYEEVSNLKETKTGVLISTNKRNYKFDKIIFTGSNQVFQNIYTVPAKTKKKLDQIKYQAINCLIVESKKKISPYYWLNIVDKDISFGGFIEHTNLVPKKIYKNHIIYVFNYLQSDNKIFQLPPEKVKELYFRDIKKIFPDFEESQVISWQLFRNPYATPIYDANYSQKQPPIKITSKVYLANTSQVYPEDRNVSNGIRLAKKVVQTIQER